MDSEMLGAAIALARNADLCLDVNPMVGALVVAGDEVVGRGWHQGSGTAHAEVMALAEAGDRAQGATLYCTLEPCNATGRVGPCVDAILAAGIAAVVFGQYDPNPHKAGGAQRLIEHGVTVRSGMLAAECRALNPTWSYMMEKGRPWVIWKTATTLDGFVAAVDGSSKWITGSEARADVQLLRSKVSAIVTGTGTVLADDPLLTVRGSEVQPLRVVVGTRSVPETAQIRNSPVEFWTGDLVALLEDLARRGHHRVLLECGPQLANAAWRAAVISEVVWYQAPVLLGTGLSAVGDIGIDSLEASRRFGQTEVNRVGLDLRISFCTGD